LWRSQRWGGFVVAVRDLTEPAPMAGATNTDQPSNGKAIPPLASFTIRAGSVRRLALSPDNQHLIWNEVRWTEQGQEYATRRWCLADGREAASLLPGEIVTAIAFSPDQNHVAISYLGGAVQLRDTTSWKEVAVLGDPALRSDLAWGLCFSRDSKSLAVGCD